MNINAEEFPQYENFSAQYVISFQFQNGFIPLNFLYVLRQLS